MHASWHTQSGRRALLVATMLALAFAFLGSRGLWDPDEGRYTNIAANMLSSGDWLVPHRQHEVGHWTKPPLTYWAVAASMGAFGLGTWGARIPSALAYLACTCMVARIARRLAPGQETRAALTFATMLLPAIASQLVTTDFLLAAFETLGMWAYVELRWGDGRARWWWVAWIAFALAFLTKGPPGLLPMLAIALAEWKSPRERRVFHVAGFAAFAVLALSWFVAVSARNPHLVPYFLGKEVIDRVATDEFRRHGEWYGWAEVYIPTLMIGTFPWTLSVVAWLRGRLPTAHDRFVAAWIVLPLVVFCIARSRLPLYLLPLFAPIAIATVLPRAGMRPMPWNMLMVWVPVLIGLRIVGASIEAPQDARAWADAIRTRAPGPIDQVVFVDDAARYGLRVHLDAEVEQVSLASVAAPDEARIDPAFDESAARELAEDPDPLRTVWIVESHRWNAARRDLQTRGFRTHALGTPWRDRVFFRVERGQGP
ncbi:Glycosyl transferase [Lysobacter dokdonensis DS-58]|uniref:Glycosyl transferase n=1 Tax=Lysobacter dokdonensis DS-58 TaxID=1300345 RepID=A0A0A2WM18_9GAMM|nr:glycosyltransferase family 39 protein [Lysobacter dokdonensis]KGQ19325.1 Glycosyl transferase [Lysobacter dokdonensis DS-58]